jgi:hypothetical protein
MKITANLAASLGAVFALVCFGVAAQGFLALGEIPEPQLQEDARGFALFWAFLGVVGAASGVGCWWLVRSEEARRSDG